MAKQAHPSLGDFPKYVAAQKRLDELEAQLASVIEAIDAREDRARVAVRDAGASAAILAEAEALLAGRPSPDRELGELLHSRQVLSKAIDIQREKVAAEVREASRQICAKLAGEHRAIIRRIDAAFEALAAGFTEERQFIDALQDQGVLVVSPLIPMPATFDLEHAGDQWRSQLQAAGYNL